MDTFNKDLDKITEREVVYDFVERLKLGNDHTIQSCDSNISKDTNLYGIIEYILNILPSSVISKIDSDKVFFKAMKITGEETINSAYIGYDCNLIAAYSDKTRFDITSALNVYRQQFNHLLILYEHTPYNFCNNFSSINASSYDDTIILVLEKN